MSILPTGIGGSLGDGEAAALVAGEDLLSRDDIPDENQQTTCFSCDQQMVGLYCHACGQRNDDYRRSILSLITETFASVFSLENRIWRTWLTLIIKPGKVSREFSDGKRTIWTSPVRIYLAMSIILFGYMSITDTRIFSVRTDIVPRADIVGNVIDLDNQSVRLSPDFGFFMRQAELDRLNKDADYDRIAILIKGIPRQELVFDTAKTSSLGVNLDDASLKSYGVWPEPEEIGGGNESETNISPITDESLRKTALLTYNDRLEEAVEVYNGILNFTRDPETILDRVRLASERGTPLDLLDELNTNMDENGLVATREALAILDKELALLGLSLEALNTFDTKISNGSTFNFNATVLGVPVSTAEVKEMSLKVLRNPALINEGVSRYLPRIMFLLMPFAAIIGITFIRGRQTALLYDHLVHAAYIHAVTFGFLLILILLSQWTPITGSIGAFMIGVMIYLPLSTKHMFQRGWFKTIFASYMIASIYGLVMFVVVTMLTAQSITGALLGSQI